MTKTCTEHDRCLVKVCWMNEQNQTASLLAWNSPPETCASQGSRKMGRMEEGFVHAGRRQPKTHLASNPGCGPGESWYVRSSLGLSGHPGGLRGSAGQKALHLQSPSLRDGTSLPTSPASFLLGEEGTGIKLRPPRLPGILPLLESVPQHLLSRYCVPGLGLGTRKLETSEAVSLVPQCSQLS